MVTANVPTGKEEQGEGGGSMAGRGVGDNDERRRGGFVPDAAGLKSHMCTSPTKVHQRSVSEQPRPQLGHRAQIKRYWSSFPAVKPHLT